jgi:hypothetical protein
VEIVLVVIVLWLLRARRRERRAARRRGRSGANRAAPRDVILADGRPALEVEGSLFAPASPGEPGWTWIPLDGAAATQEAHARTLRELRGGLTSPPDVDGSDPAGVEFPVVLMALGTRRRVNAVDAYATGGRLGHLPADAVRRYGDGVRRVHAVDGRPAGVTARMHRDAEGRLVAQLLLPEGFAHGSPR